MTGCRGARAAAATTGASSSSRNSYDPLLDIDWDADVDLDMAYMPFERVSIYGTAQWEALTEAQQLYKSSGYREVQPFNDERYAHHWFEKVLS